MAGAKHDEDEDFLNPYDDEDLDMSFALMLQEHGDEIESYEKATFNNMSEERLKRIDEDLDYSFALMLQEEVQEVEKQEQMNSHKISTEVIPSKPLSVVDPEWEKLDPSPDIHSLFIQFNYQFFWGVLEHIEVRWSPRMTLCAGVCCYEGRGGLCSVRLSQSLLKYRPRRDLVETLLHEMIHAYLFVTDNNKDHDGHGPEFLKHMNRINAATGARISVYHSFHDEVDYQRQHWWKCNGPCQNRRPYFGIVKRAMNRAPAPRDPWWSDHQAKCGGTFTKIKEPESFGQKKQNKRKPMSATSNSKSDTKDIRGFLSPKSSGNNIHGFSDSGNSRIKNAASNSNSSTSDNGILNLLYGKTASNVHTVSSQPKKPSTIVPFSGAGFTLGNGVSGSLSNRPWLQNTHDNKNGSKNLGRYESPPGGKHGGKAFGKSIPGASGSAGRNFGSKGSQNKSHSPRGGGSTRTLSGSGSRTVVLNKKQKVKDEEDEKRSYLVQNATQGGTSYFTGAGHVLGDSRSSTNTSLYLGQQKSLNDFFQTSPSSSSSSSIMKDKSSKTVVIFSSDSEDDETSEKVKKEGQSKDQGTTGSSAADRGGENKPEELVTCPVCNSSVRKGDINFHLDSCLK